MTAERGRLAAVIGAPIAHSLSPAIHRAAFAAAGRDWTYAAFDVAPGHAAEALAAMRVLGIVGYSVTTPHKEAMAVLVDEVDAAAAALRSVNTVTQRPDGTLHGASTDGDGLVGSLAAEDVTLDGAEVVVLGAGAAARSVVDAVGRAGAGSLTIVNRTPERAAAAAELAAGATVASADSVEDAVRSAAVVVNATSVGFGVKPGSDEPLPVSADWLGPGQVVVDLVYHPLDTPLLRAARAAGAGAVDGLGMLVHQAALQQQLWTGELPDVTLMRAAAEAELARRRS